MIDKTPSRAKLIDILRALRSETQPIDGHPDPGALEDCWNEVFDRIQQEHEMQQEIEQYKQFEQKYNEFIKSWEKYQQDKEKMIEGLHNYMKELDRRYQKAYRNYDIDCDHHQLGMAEAYEVAERRLRDILKEIGVMDGDTE